MGFVSFQRARRTLNCHRPIANQVLELPNSERSKLTSKEFNQIRRRYQKLRQQLQSANLSFVTLR